MRGLVGWMDSEGMATETLKQVEWENFDMWSASQKKVDTFEEPIAKFFLKHNKKELYDGALERHMMLYGVNHVNEIVEDDQLAARDYWVNVEHPELGSTITYPNAWVKLSETSCGIRRRAPSLVSTTRRYMRKR